MIRMAVVISVLLATALSAHSSDARSNATSIRMGQWIWSQADEEVFLATKCKIPDLLPGIWISTIAVKNGAISQHLAVSPALTAQGHEAAVVVRIDDSMHALWDVKGPQRIALEIDSRLGRLMELLSAAGVQPREVQLDYDCPVRRLSAWAAVVRALSKRSLKGREVWITSLPEHLAEPMYSTWFQHVAAGHILQLFDTGLSFNGETVRMLSDRLETQHMPFRVGLGAFERVRPTGTTDHRDWFGTLSAFSEMPGYRGAWIFPGGRKWSHIYRGHGSN